MSTCDHPDALISALATPCLGLVTTAGLRAAGVSEREQRTREANGQLHRVFRAVFRVGVAALDRPSLRAAALLRLGDSAAFVDHGAAECLDLLPPLESWLHVGVPGGRRRLCLVPELPMLDGTRPRVLVRQAPRLQLDLAPLQEERSTSAARTLVDLASNGPQRFDRAWREAGYLGVLDPAAIQAVLAGGKYRGRRRVEAKLENHYDIIRGDRGPESPAEYDAIQLVLAAGIVHPLVNHWIDVVGGRRRADLFWPFALLAVEIDGWDGHSSPESFVDDRVRDNELLAVGVLTMRFAASYVERHPQEVAAQILRQLALRSAGQPA